MKKKFLDDMSMPAPAAKTKSGKSKGAPPWAAGDDAEAEDDVLEDMGGDDAAPAEATDTEEAGSSSLSLAEASDDELLAELEKRGLGAGAPDGAAEEEEEDEF